MSSEKKPLRGVYADNVDQDETKDVGPHKNTVGNSGGENLLNIANLPLDKVTNKKGQLEIICSDRQAELDDNEDSQAHIGIDRIVMQTKITEPSVEKPEASDRAKRPSKLRIQTSVSKLDKNSHKMKRQSVSTKNLSRPK